jgi:hypothetical protein
MVSGFIDTTAMCIPAAWVDLGDAFVVKRTTVIGAKEPSAHRISNDRYPNPNRTLVAALAAFRFCPF